jgi:PAS domain S-box-containing protein
MEDADITKERLAGELMLLRQRVNEFETAEAERKRTEDALRRSEHNYRVLFESTLDGMFVLDAETMRVVLANQNAARIYGFDCAEDVVGVNPLDYVYTDDRDRALTLIVEDLFEKDLRKIEEFRTRTRDGRGIWVSAVGTRTEYQGKMAGLISVRDITERKRSEKALKESEEQYSALVANLADAVLISKEGKITWCNDRTEEILGYKKDELLGKDASFFLWEGANPSEFVAEAYKVTEGRSHFRGTTKMMKKNGEVADIEYSISRISGKAPPEFVMVARDVTERKRSEEKLQELYEQERKLRQELEAEMIRRVEFTRALAHELKTPLTPVMASSELLAAELREEPLLSLARNINRGAANLNNRIDELLDLARGEIGMLQLKLEPVDLEKLLREVADDMSPVASSHGQALVLELPSSLPLARADEGRLRQVVLNLLSNASKFTPERGKIVLRAREDGADLVVEVQDTGRGITAEEQQRLFEPYHRLESDREHLSGLGLGLALCKTLVELHGGRIWVQSEAGKGSTFGFSVPQEAAGKQASGRGIEGKS